MCCSLYVALCSLCVVCRCVSFDVFWLLIVLCWLVVWFRQLRVDCCALLIACCCLLLVVCCVSLAVAYCVLLVVRGLSFDVVCCLLFVG